MRKNSLFASWNVQSHLGNPRTLAKLSFKVLLENRQLAAALVDGVPFTPERQEGCVDLCLNLVLGFDID